MTKSPSVPVRLAISWLTNALVLAVVVGVLGGVHVTSAGALLAAAAVFGAPTAELPATSAAVDAAGLARRGVGHRRAVGPPLAQQLQQRLGRVSAGGAE